MVAGGNGGFLAARLNADGTLDAGFATSGYYTAQILNSDYVSTVALQEGGRILLIGKVTATGYSADAGVISSSFNVPVESKHIRPVSKQAILDGYKNKSTSEDTRPAS